MKKSAFLLIIGTLVMSQLEGHVSLTYPLGGEIFSPGDTVNVTWQEVIRHNTLNWDLLFSYDGGSTWDTIKADIPLGILNYQWIVPDTSIMEGKIRIVQDNENQNYTGTSDNFTISYATGIIDPMNPIRMHIYPNPFRNYTTIEFADPMHKNYTLTLYSLQGKMVKTIQNITGGRVSVERTNLTAGLYFIQLRDENKICAVGKLIVE